MPSRSPAQSGPAISDSVDMASNMLQQLAMRSALGGNQARVDRYVPGLVRAVLGAIFGATKKRMRGPIWAFTRRVGQANGNCRK